MRYSHPSLTAQVKVYQHPPSSVSKRRNQTLKVFTKNFEHEDPAALIVQIMQGTIELRDRWVEWMEEESNWLAGHPYFWDNDSTTPLLQGRSSWYSSIGYFDFRSGEQYGSGGLMSSVTSLQLRTWGEAESMIQSIGKLADNTDLMYYAGFSDIHRGRRGRKPPLLSPTESYANINSEFIQHGVLDTLVSASEYVRTKRLLPKTKPAEKRRKLFGLFA